MNICFTKNENIYESFPLYNGSKKEIKCSWCCLGITFYIINIVSMIGIYNVLFYISIDPYIDKYNEIIKNTFLNNNQQANEILQKIPILINTACQLLTC